MSPNYEILIYKKENSGEEEVYHSGVDITPVDYPRVIPPHSEEFITKDVWQTDGYSPGMYILRVNLMFPHEKVRGETVIEIL
ncbi:MAG: hypothetical protein QMD21_06655 [Candidatus Thermoplasmatota archaeon]|nr:hypothetical protein [Candidatus Thermoplasmatota archaeon]